MLKDAESWLGYIVAFVLVTFFCNGIAGTSGMGCKNPERTRQSNLPCRWWGLRFLGVFGNTPEKIARSTVREGSESGHPGCAGASSLRRNY
jgi:hypothetical protein